jgi:hypothetical protein
MAVYGVSPIQRGPTTLQPRLFDTDRVQGDLAALTAATGDEFAMFTTGGRR